MRDKYLRISDDLTIRIVYHTEVSGKEKYVNDYHKAWQTKDIATHDAAMAAILFDTQSAMNVIDKIEFIQTSEQKKRVLALGYSATELLMFEIKNLTAPWLMMPSEVRAHFDTILGS